MTTARAVLLCAALALAGCGPEPARQQQGEADPAMSAALELPLLSDPDLASQSNRFALLSAPGPVDYSLPSASFSDAARSAAHAEAMQLVGGPVPPLPAPAARACASCRAPTLAGRAQALGRGCGDRLEAGFAWSARFARELPIYPRSHLLEAAGRDEPGCAARAARFVAPVPAGEAVSFYAALGRSAGFTVTGLRDGDVDVLRGERRGDRANFLVLAAPDANGSRVDLIAVS